MLENDETELSEPLVYIIILNWNGKEDTLSCLQSIAKIHYSNYRICLVDNASTDDSVQVVSKKFPKVKIISNTENLRFARGNNVGIEFALENNADYVLLLNNDTEVDVMFLNELVKIAETDSKVGMVGPKIYHFQQPDLIWSAGGKISFWKGQVAHYGLRKRDSKENSVNRSVDFLTGCALLVKRQVITNIGLLDASYYIYGEDADWCERARRAGFKLFYAADAKILHKISSSSGGGLTPFKAYHKVKSNFMFFKRYARWYHWVTIPFMVLMATISFVFNQIVHGNFGIISSLLKGFMNIFRNLGGMYQETK